MLQQFSWGQFLLAWLVLSFVWYCFVVLFFYRRELSALVGIGPSESLPHRWDKGVEALDRDTDTAFDGGDVQIGDSLMGGSAVPDGMQVMAMSQLSFAPADSGDTRYGQVGMVADVIQELKGIFARLESQGGSKDDLLGMLERLKEDYGKIGAHPSVGAINGFIAANVPFDLSARELEDLWN